MRILKAFVVLVIIFSAIKTNAAEKTITQSATLQNEINSLYDKHKQTKDKSIIFKDLINLRKHVYSEMDQLIIERQHYQPEYLAYLSDIESFFDSFFYYEEYNASCSISKSALVYLHFGKNEERTFEQLVFPQATYEILRLVNLVCPG